VKNDTSNIPLPTEVNVLKFIGFLVVSTVIIYGLFAIRRDYKVEQRAESKSDSS